MQSAIILHSQKLHITRSSVYKFLNNFPFLLTLLQTYHSLPYFYNSLANTIYY